MTLSPKPVAKTIADWLLQPEDLRLELIDGEFVEKAAPSIDHAIAQAATVAHLYAHFHRKVGGGGIGLGGWWLATEVDVEMDGRIYRPDVAGWRRERVPVMPKERPVRIRPDWICEIVSDSNRTTDTIKKVRRYHQSGVPHYWILDQLDRTLTVHRHSDAGYLIALRASAEETIRAEPFEAVELKVGELFGDDPE